MTTAIQTYLKWDNSLEAQQAAALVWCEYLERRCWREWERDQ